MRRAIAVTFLALASLLSGRSVAAQNGSLRVTVPSPTAASLGKFGDLPVSLYTGTPDISIPLFTLKGRTLDLPIVLKYHASGIRVEDIGGWAGLGWALEAGGAITRTVHGIVDEKPQGYLNTGNIWYNSSNWPQPVDATVISQILQAQVDGDPDEFFFDFAGGAGQFVMGPISTAGTIEYRAIPSQKIRIQPSGANPITSWVITTGDGTRYTFGASETTTDYSSGSNWGGDSHVSSWHLTKIQSAGGDSITLYYTAYTARHRMGFYREEFSEIQFLQPPCPPGSNPYLVTNEYEIQAQRLDSIKGATHTVKFTAGSVLRTDALSPLGAQQEPRLDKITVTTPIGTVLRVFQLEQDYTLGGRLTLKNVYEQDLSGVRLPPYSFTYNPLALPSRTSFAQDHWGYYNGKTANTTPIPAIFHATSLIPPGDPVFYPGSDRSPDAASMQAGVLTRITYPTGGYSEFVYEANEYGLIKAGGQMVDDGPPQVSSIASTPFQGVQSTTFTVGGVESVQGTVYLSEFVHSPPTGCQNGDPLHPCPFGGVVQKGEWYTPGTYYVVLAPGTYTLRASAAGYNVDIAISVNWRDRVIVTKKPAGGLRVAEQRTADALGNVSIQKYRYTLQSDPTQSSGIIGVEPRYDLGVSGGNCSYYSRASTSKMPLGAGTSGQVAYSEVTVLHGASGEYGTTRHVFRSMIEAGDGYSTTSWPYARRTSFEWARGQPSYTTEYNAAGQPQRQVSAAYAFDQVGPVAARRFRGMSVYVFNGGGAAYYNAFEVISGWIYQSGETTTQYDTTGASSFVNSKTFLYGNPNHMQVTELQETNSDGTQRITRMKYPADYATGTANPEASALTAMQGTAFIHDAVIERWVIKRVGTADSVVQAQLTTWRQFAPGQYLPYCLFVLNSPSPLP